MREQSQRLFICVSDLKKFLEDQNISPEELSRRVPVSNMTWRRLLQLPPETELPEKYRQILTHLVSESYLPIQSPTELVLEGYGTDRKQFCEKIIIERKQNTLSDFEILEISQKKIDECKINTKLWNTAKEVFSLTKSGHPARLRLLAIAGLLYFINPFDLIADSIFSIGLLDDLGVLSLVLIHWKGQKVHG